MQALAKEGIQKVPLGDIGSDEAPERKTQEDEKAEGIVKWLY
jgi:hypothetical protein